MLFHNLSHIQFIDTAHDLTLVFQTCLTHYTTI